MSDLLAEALIILFEVLCGKIFCFIGNSDLLRRKKKHIFAEHMLDKTAF